MEDNLDHLKILRVNLERAGFEVLEARDGPAGLACARDRQPDAILLDVAMPGCDGYDVCRSLKADAGTRGIPVVIITAVAGPGDERRSAEAGAVRFLPKPFEPGDVTRAVGDVLG